MIVETHKDGALQRLAGAVLIQARKDYDTGSDAKRPEVEDWVEKRTEGDMSFELCCQLLELDPDYTRQRLFRSHLGCIGVLRRSSTHRTNKPKMAHRQEAA